MAKLKFSGPFHLRLQSFAVLNWIAIMTSLRHAMGRRIAPDWDIQFEIGILFWRHQFKAALSNPDITQGRLLFESLNTETSDRYDVTTEPCTAPQGNWYYPKTQKTDMTLLYLHGGGYTFQGAIAKRFAEMLAHHTGASVFTPDYRLTPEHSHPAQAEDALIAWQYLIAKTDPSKIVVIGDSAGGHMSLMLLQTLKSLDLAQPALCIGLSPWTDIGESGQSMHENDQYDLVQSWMALRFGKWLDPKGEYGRAALSPVTHDFTDLAPIYLQAGGREVLFDMITEFAETQRANGADITLDIWPDMPHDFQAFDSLKTSSTEALAKIAKAVKARE